MTANQINRWVQFEEQLAHCTCLIARVPLAGVDLQQIGRHVRLATQYLNARLEAGKVCIMPTVSKFIAGGFQFYTFVSDASCGAAIIKSALECFGWLDAAQIARRDGLAWRTIFPQDGPFDLAPDLPPLPADAAEQLNRLQTALDANAARLAQIAGEAQDILHNAGGDINHVLLGYAVVAEQNEATRAELDLARAQFAASQ